MTQPRTEAVRPSVEAADRGEFKPTPSVRLLIVHPHEMVRRGLEAMAAELEMVGEVSVFPSVEAARRGRAWTRTDVLICQSTATETLVTTGCPHSMKVLSLMEGSEDQHLAAAAESPADGFLLTTDLTAGSLADSLVRLQCGEMPLPASLSRWLLGQLRTRTVSRSDRLYLLTPREYETLHLLAQGMSNKQIARALSISQHGAKRHVANVIAKLNCPNRTLAVALALREGIIADDGDGDS